MVCFCFKNREYFSHRIQPLPNKFKIAVMIKITKNNKIFKIKIYTILFFVFMVNESVFAKTTNNNLPKIKHLILSLNQLNDNASSFGSMLKVKCTIEIFEDQFYVHTQEYYNKSKDDLLNLIQTFTTNNVVDKSGRAITQSEVNKMVEKVEKLQLRNNDLEKVSNMTTSNKNIPLKARAQTV